MKNGPNTYPLESDSSGGEHFSPFEQLGPDKVVKENKESHISYFDTTGPTTVPTAPTTAPSTSPAAGLEDSEILKGDASYQSALATFLKPVVQSNSHWKRCWRASVDGWAAETFHSGCDGEGPTVTIVRVGQYIFGGYTSISWSK